MSIKLTRIGTLAVRDGEAIPEIRRKIAGTSRLAGFSDVDATRLAATVSELGRHLLSGESGVTVEVFLYGTSLIEGLALSFPAIDAVADHLSRLNYFDQSQEIGQDQSASILVVKYLRGRSSAIEARVLIQFEELLSQMSREELMGALHAKNEELEAHKVNLERTVAERTASLSDANKELEHAREKAEDATKTKAAFLAAMSHEIRTPMTGVIGMVDMLVHTTLDDDQRQMMRTVRDSAYALLTIINDILDFSKIEAGKLELESIPFSLRDTVEGMAETLGPNANNKGIRINIHVDPDIPDAVLGDQVRIRQILFNIGGNAVKFTEEGRVLIRAFSTPSSDKNMSTVRFEVIDSGIGITKEALADLFTEFSQAESSTTRRFGGTGLGLSICQRLTEMMDGEIKVESEFGNGSTFIVTLTFPIAESHTIRSDGHDLAGLRVLFVGDDAEEGELDAEYLRHWGADVTTFGERAESVVIQAARQQQPFDVVVLGSTWSLQTRHAHIKSIRKEGDLARTVFVLMTETRTKAERIDIPSTVYVESDPLRRAPFIQAVAVAAGRTSPDISHEDEEIGVEAIKPPTIEDAEAAGTLILVAEDNTVSN
jgi:signal transduction histidine kinase